jgi:hypothetical protein
MTNITKPSLADLAARIQREHESAAGALKSAVIHAIEAGSLLLEAKRQLKHGGWLQWLHDNCEIPERTVQAYMRLARLPVEKRSAVADLPLRDALSAIRSREERNARAGEAINRPAPGPARFLFQNAKGEYVSVPAPGLMVAPEHQHLLLDRAAPPPTPPNPQSEEEAAEELILQLDQLRSQWPVHVSNEALRAAFDRRFAQGTTPQAIAEWNRDGDLSIPDDLSIPPNLRRESRVSEDATNGH